MRKLNLPTLFLILALALPAHSQETICKGFSDAEIERRLDELTTLVTCSMEVSLGNCQLQAGIGATGAAVLGSSAVAAMLKNRPEVCGIQGTSAANKIWSGIFPEAFAVPPCYKPFDRGASVTTIAGRQAERVSRGMVAKSAEDYFTELNADAKKKTLESEKYIEANWQTARSNLTHDRVGADVKAALEDEKLRAAIRKDRSISSAFEAYHMDDTDAKKLTYKKNAYLDWDFDKSQANWVKLDAEIKRLPPDVQARFQQIRDQNIERAKSIKRALDLAEEKRIAQIDPQWTKADHAHFPRAAKFMENAETRAEMPRHSARYENTLTKLKKLPANATLDFLQPEMAQIHTIDPGQAPDPKNPARNTSFARVKMLRSRLESQYFTHTGSQLTPVGARWQARMTSPGVLSKVGHGAKSLLAISPAALAFEAGAHISPVGCDVTSPYEQHDENCKLIPELTGPFVNFLTMDPEYRIEILKKDPNMCSVLSQTYDNVAGTWDLKCQSSGVMMVNKKFPQRAVKLEQDSEGGPLSVKMLFEDKNPRSNFEMKFDRSGEPTEASVDQWKSHTTRARTRDFDPKNNKNRQWEGPDFIQQKLDATGASANAFRSEFSDEMAEYKTRLAQISTAQICCQSRESAQNEPGCSAFSEIQHKSGSGPSARRGAVDKSSGQSK